MIVRVTSSWTFTALIKSSVHFGPDGFCGSIGVTPGVGFGFSLLSGLVGSNDGTSTTIAFNFTTNSWSAAGSLSNVVLFTPSPGFSNPFDTRV